MGFIKDFREYRSIRREEQRVSSLEELLLQAGISTNTLTEQQALNIPALVSCIELISNTVAMLPIKLYKEVDGKVEEVLNDDRTKLLNCDTQDTLNAYQFKKALVKDYLINGVGYAYINKERNKVKSLHYVPYNQVSIIANQDPIFKDYEVLVNGSTYRPFEFIKFTKNTKDGVTGTGVLKECNDILQVAYNSIRFENILLTTGGNKKGFIKSNKKLSDEALTALKNSWNNLYRNNSENCVVLNEGLEFQEASSSSVELQLNENKQTNAKEISKIFNVPYNFLDGKSTREEYGDFIKSCILPILNALVTALNKDLLLEVEKDLLYFDVETDALLQGDIEKRYKAYESALKGGWLMINEVRKAENYPAIEGLDIVPMSLGDVIFDCKTQQYFIPNMDTTNDLKVEEVKEEVEEN